MFDDPEALAHTAASIVQQAAQRSGPDRFRLALSGGSTPRRLLEVLADQIEDWSRIDIFQVDERIAPAGSPDRNLTMFEQTLPAEARARIHAMPVDDADLDAAATTYAARLPDRFNLVVLGIGDDGHTASLFGGDPALAIDDRDVVVTHRHREWRRMTLTYPV
ncbi:MAG: 6-phosphogluconolactonase, partial [Acidimicrobiales bacterium]